MKLKIADFGLATFVDYNFYNNSKNTCGTPNYISPEMLDKKGYSYEVDLWSVGVTLYNFLKFRYTMLYGIAPFETKKKEAQETYEKIRACDYNLIDPFVSREAKDLIGKILVLDSNKRISLNAIMTHPFVSFFPIPRVLACKYK
jgi:polo-like kinase 1